MKHNYTETLKKVLGDLEGWASLPNSLQAHISIVKMNVEPRMNFVSSIVPLSPPAGYWGNRHVAVSKFIWNGKRLRHSVERICEISCRCHLQSPIFNNKGLLIGACHLLSVGKSEGYSFG